ncbi:hypothetical protein [Absidia glauca]|uniref:Uncharacterized protein n=1 Tax=Absidia glauca TaxID=4829 RepID=A0A163JSW0_ABSGL|nr:hypothetical protein [Absidia glauca]
MTKANFTLPIHSPYINEALLTRYPSSQLGLDAFRTSVTSDPIPVQMGFVGRVVLLVLGQLLGTFAFTMCLQPAWLWLQSTLARWIPLALCALVAVLIIWQLWVLYFQLVTPARIVMLTLFSCLSSFVIVVNCCYEDGLLVMNLVGSGLVSFYCYTLQHKFHFSGPSPWFIGMAVVCLNASWLRFIFDLDALEILAPIGLAGVICTYVLLDLYYIMDNISGEDVILATTCLYVDVLYPMRCLHHLCELSDNLNMLDVLYPGPPHIE